MTIREGASVFYLFEVETNEAEDQDAAAPAYDGERGEYDLIHAAVVDSLTALHYFHGVKEDKGAPGTWLWLVMAESEGEAEALVAFTPWCRRGFQDIVRVSPTPALLPLPGPVETLPKPANGDFLSTLPHEAGREEVNELMDRLAHLEDHERVIAFWVINWALRHFALASGKVTARDANREGIGSMIKFIHAWRNVERLHAELEKSNEEVQRAKWECLEFGFDYDQWMRDLKRQIHNN